MSEISILYEDAQLLALEKPSGLLTVPGRSVDKQDCLLTRIQKTFPEVLLVHRLDRDTSGVLLFARDTETQRRLGRLFELRQVRKKYVAIVDGVVQGGQTIELPIRRDIRISLPPTYIVDHENGRAAISELQIDSVVGEQTRVFLKPRTGRSHQLRVHCQAIGHPISGDPIYGQTTVAGRLMLHAARLSFRHPTSNTMISIESPTPF